MPGPDPASPLASEPGLVGTALALGAGERPRMVRDARRRSFAICDPPAPGAAGLRGVRALIDEGADPLGEAFCRLRSPERRRPDGATYTPAAIVESMVAWAADESAPARVVDPGAGSGRFAVAAGRRFPRAQVLAVELDPVAAICCRGHLAAAGLAGRARVEAVDYRALPREASGEPGGTLYLGNPPYVRHHQIAAAWKEWLTLTARAHGLEASQLAGLHVHFFLATAVRRPDGRSAEPSSPRPSGSTPTTDGWCASCSSGAWAARRCTSWSPPRCPSGTRP